MSVGAGAIAAAALAAAAIAISGAGGSEGTESPSDRLAMAASRLDSGQAMRYLRRQVRLGPRPAGSDANRRLTRWIAKRYRSAGLRRVRIQRPHRNVVGRIPGRRRGAIVVGAHHDTWPGDPDFVGANDGASGVAVLLALARALPERMPGPKVVLAAFDAEEARPGRAFAADGARGSRQFVRIARRGGGSGVPRLRSIKAMILFDMVGDCNLSLPREAGSDERLYRRIARRGAPAVFAGSVGAIQDDHTPFADAGIPAVDLIDFQFGPGDRPGEWWHTTEDTLDTVCRSSLAAAGRPVERALRAWGRRAHAAP